MVMVTEMDVDDGSQVTKSFFSLALQLFVEKE
jgi:hypothetical protein